MPFTSFDSLLFGSLCADEGGVVGFILAWTRTLLLLTQEALLQLGLDVLLLMGQTTDIELLLLVEVAILHGQISTSIVKLLDVFVEIELRSHFVLSGAWSDVSNLL